LARSPRTFFQLGDERRTPLLTHDKAFGCGEAIDIAFDVEQEINAFDGLEGNRRERRRGLSSTGIGGDVGQHEELAPRMAPAERLRHGAGFRSGR
jgi:hypothetical protein